MGRSVKYSSAVLTGLKSYSDAVNARVEAYTAESYQCPWSQRSPQFMFSEFGLKQYYDAANTGCCDERIRPFASKPQYAEVSAAMTPKDCFREVVSIGCSTLEAPDKSIYGCASSVLETQFNVICPQMCEQFSDLASSNSVGKYGKFSLVGKSTEEDWVVKYRLNDEVRQNVFDRCLGEMTVKDAYCEYGVIETKIMASLDDPDGCYCDCCGNNGLFAPPTHQWQNVTFGSTMNAAIAVNPVLNTACKEGRISSGYGSWGDGLGSVVFSWVTDSMYKSDGTQHYVERIGSIGDRNHPACCGFDFALTGSDGCGWSGVHTGNVSRHVGNPVLSPASGTLFYQGTNAEITVNGVCIDSNMNTMSSTRSCLQNSSENISGSGSQIRLSVPLALNTTHACNACCGNGTLNVSYNDGCNKTGAGSYPVRKTLNVGNIGHALRCSMYFDSGASKYLYRAQHTNLSCGGGLGYIWTDAYSSGYEKVADCVAAIRNKPSSYCGFDNCVGKGCCYYADNGGAGTSYQGAVICVKDSMCCNIGSYTQNGSWVTKGEDCCTHDGKIAN